MPSIAIATVQNAAPSLWISMCFPADAGQEKRGACATPAAAEPGPEPMLSGPSLRYPGLR